MQVSATLGLLALTLILSTLVAATELKVLLFRELKFRQALKIYCTTIALNRLLLTGSGYAASIWKLKNDRVPLYKALSSFAIMEIFSLAPWIGAGVYFGARFGKEFPLVIAAVLCFMALFFLLMKKRIVNFIHRVLQFLSEIKYRVLFIIPLVVFNFLFSIGYYYLFFNIYGISLSPLVIVKVMAMAITVGYFSLVPSGIGIKEGSIVFLLMQEGVSLTKALSFAVADRVVTTFFYLALGLIFGSGIMREEIRKRFGKK